MKLFMKCKPKYSAPICTFVEETNRYIEDLEVLSNKFDTKLAICFILSRLPITYKQFVSERQLNKMEDSIIERHHKLINVEQEMKEEGVSSNSKNSSIG